MLLSRTWGEGLRQRHTLSNTSADCQTACGFRVWLFYDMLSVLHTQLCAFDKSVALPRALAPIHTYLHPYTDADRHRHTHTKLSTLVFFSFLHTLSVTLIHTHWNTEPCFQCCGNCIFDGSGNKCPRFHAVSSWCSAATSLSSNDFEALPSLITQCRFLTFQRVTPFQNARVG